MRMGMGIGMLRCGLASMVMVGVACSGSSSKPDGGPGGSGGAGGDPNRWTGTLAAINRNVDILFLIDDSTSMKLLQDKLIQSIPTFFLRLQDPPGLPNFHIAVVSQDMGAGDGSIGQCNATGGKNGIFQNKAGGTCTATNLQAGARYISNIAGVSNFTGNAGDVLACIAALGEGGCGFEHQFAALLRALGADGSPAPVENEGFLRPEAYLAIIMLTNEDDCSEVPGVKFFETNTNTNLASPLGPPINFRCNLFGHLCDDGSGNQVRPNPVAPNNDLASMVTYASCTSNETGQNLRTVADTASRIKALKTDAGQVAVIAIQGPSTPYTVTWKASNPVDTSCGAANCPWPAVAHACTSSDTTFADPAVRSSEFVRAFGANGLELPICATDLTGDLDRAAMLINHLFAPTCISGPVGGTHATGPDCKVTSHQGNVTKAIPSCADTLDVPPCWQLLRDPTCPVGGVLTVSPDPNLGPSDPVVLTYDCAKCLDPTGMCY